MKKTWIAFALMACLSFAACGNGGTDGGGDGDNGEPEVPVSPVVGTWVLDTDAAVKLMEEKLAAEPNPMGEMFKGMLKSMKAEMEVVEDGTFSVNVEMPNPAGGEAEKKVASGTWSLEGETITITTLEEDGEAPDQPDVQTAAFKDGMIWLTPEGAPFTLTFKKK